MSNVSSDTNINILLIEDEFSIRRFLRSGLLGASFKLVEAGSGAEGLQLAATHNPQLILLDLGLPDMDGLEVVSKLREWTKVPIIILSARGQEKDKIQALDLGADDYLTKPFQLGELLARIRAVMRRGIAGVGDKHLYSVGDLTIDLKSRIVTVRGKSVHLTPKEFSLLVLLARYEGCVITHKQLLVEVWGRSAEAETHYLRVFMKNLRHKLELEPARPRHLITEPGVGYRLGGFENE